MILSRDTRSSWSSEERGLLDEKAPQENAEQVRQYRQHSASRSYILWISLLLNTVLTISLALLWPQISSLSQHDASDHNVFSPADEAVEYETVVFRTGLQNDRTPYTGSSDAVNEAWEELYNDFGLSLIDKSAADKLPNQTAAASFDTSKYVVQIDVFHQLHCLNRLRKRLYPDKYVPDMSDDEIVHGEHCVESLRQSLQCHSDVATIFWEWSEKDGFMKGNTATTHRCKNFAKIQEWGREHLMEEDDDLHVHTPGAPLRKDSILDF